MYPKFFLFFSFLAWTVTVQAQQTIRGTVTDQQTLAPLVGAQVVLLDSEPIKGALTNERGEFRIEQVPIGRQAIQITYLGYAAIVRGNLIVNNSQEIVLEVAMEEQVNTMEEVVISATIDKKRSLNELTTVSARVFSMEEAMRYAGSRNDPARMAQNYAGVSGANDSRNDIIIRGNSPTGVLWRLEGIDIPNPNHFGALGTTGGPVSMLNNNNLSDADFMTSAFPAEYGNALAGVFDLNLRNGNNEKHEFMGQIGFNGFEVGVEGPFSKNSRASYVANYRYSTLGVFKALGFDFGTGAAVPEYQDLTFKVNMPTEKNGRFVLFGMGGFSSISFLDSEEDGADFYGGEGEDLYNKGAAGVVGLSHTYLFNESTYGKLTLAASGIRSANEIDSLSISTGEPAHVFANEYETIKYSAHYQVNKKFSAKDQLRVGALFEIMDVQLLDSIRQSNGLFRRIRDVNGTTELFQAYAQWQHRFSNQLSFNAGLHFQQFFLNDTRAIEPRLGLTYQFTPKQKLSLGFGVHNQLQPLPIYFIQTRMESNQFVSTNEDLDFVRSNHLVLGYDNSLGSNLRLKAEVYYQWVDQAAVERTPSTFSLLNFGADFGFPDRDSLFNGGKGRNYGVELTLEKFFSNSYYFLFTTSLFNSEYTGSDNVWRNTAFNGNYIFNLLGGREFKLGKNTLSLDIRGTFAGGRRYTEIDLEGSRLRGETERFDDRAFEEQYDPYFRLDFKGTYRMNSRKITQEWSVDLQNLTNRDNIFDQVYSRSEDAIESTYQIGLFPVIQYRILF